MEIERKFLAGILQDIEEIYNQLHDECPIPAAYKLGQLFNKIDSKINYKNHCYDDDETEDDE